MTVMSIIKLQAQKTKEKKRTHEISKDVTMHAMWRDDDEVQIEVQ